MRTALFTALLLIVAPLAFASDLDDVINNVVKTYGGAAAWTKVAAIHETGTVDSPMSGKGDTTRDWAPGRKLRVEIQYAKNKEVRDLNGDHGTRNGQEVTGMGLDAMVLQWARMSIPAMLIAHRAELRDMGVKDGLRVLEIPLSSTMTVMAAIDPKSGHIVRSGSEGKGMQFVTEYHDYRTAGGLLFAFSEENFAQGMRTGATTLSTIDVK
jgi:hypothetical protein